MSNPTDSQHWLTQSPQQILTAWNTGCFPQDRCSEVEVHTFIIHKGHLLIVRLAGYPGRIYKVPKWAVPSAARSQPICQFVLQIFRQSIQQNQLQNVQMPDCTWFHPLRDARKGPGGIMNILRVAVTLSIDGFDLDHEEIEFVPLAHVASLYVPGSPNQNFVKAVVGRIQATTKTNILLLTDRDKMKTLTKMIGICLVIKGVVDKQEPDLGVIVQQKDSPDAGLHVIPLSEDRHWEMMKRGADEYVENPEAPPELQIRHKLVGWFNSRPRRWTNYIGIALPRFQPDVMSSCFEDDGRLKIGWRGDR